MAQKMTLLQMVQSILTDMDSDQINSINDTLEAQQVARVIRETYNVLVTNNVIPEHRNLLRVESVSDTNRPNYLKMPTTLDKLVYFKYNTKSATDTNDKMTSLEFVEPEEFLERVTQRNSGDSNVQSISDFSGAVLFVENDKQPEFWTTFDDEYMVFDSFDNTVSSTLLGNRTLAFGVENREFDVDDAFTPDIDANFFPLLLSEAKGMSFINFKQTENPKVERQSRSMRTSLDNNNRARIERNPADRQPNYGRK